MSNAHGFQARAHSQKGPDWTWGGEVFIFSFSMAQSFASDFSSALTSSNTPK